MQNLDELESYTTAALKETLKNKDLNPNGDKKTLISRLRKHDMFMKFAEDLQERFKIQKQENISLQEKFDSVVQDLQEQLNKQKKENMSLQKQLKSQRRENMSLQEQSNSQIKENLHDIEIIE